MQRLAFHRHGIPCRCFDVLGFWRSCERARSAIAIDRCVSTAWPRQASQRRPSRPRLPMRWRAGGARFDQVILSIGFCLVCNRFLMKWPKMAKPDAHDFHSLHTVTPIERMDVGYSRRSIIGATDSFQRSLAMFVGLGMASIIPGAPDPGEGARGLRRHAPGCLLVHQAHPQGPGRTGGQRQASQAHAPLPIA